MAAVITIALPIFAIIAAGFVSGKFGFLTSADGQALNRFVFRFAMPAALFGLAAGTPPPGAADIGIAVSYSVAALVALFAGYFCSRAFFQLSGPEAGAHGFSSTLGNAVFLGLPIALNIDGWARPFIVLMLIEGTLVIALGAALMTKHSGNVVSYLSGPAKNPLVVAMAAGFVYSAIGLPFEGPAQTFFDYLGRAAGPTALFSLGHFLATHAFPPLRSVAGRISLIAIVKLGLLPAIALAVAALTGVDDPAYLGPLALFSLVPSGVGTFVMASQYRVYQTEAAAAVSLTTILSILTISAVLIVFL